MRDHILVCPFDEELIRKFHLRKDVIALHVMVLVNQNKMQGSAISVMARDV